MTQVNTYVKNKIVKQYLITLMEISGVDNGVFLVFLPTLCVLKNMHTPDNSAFTEAQKEILPQNLYMVYLHCSKDYYQILKYIIARSLPSCYVFIIMSNGGLTLQPLMQVAVRVSSIICILNHFIGKPAIVISTVFVFLIRRDALACWESLPILFLFGEHHFQTKLKFYEVCNMYTADLNKNTHITGEQKISILQFLFRHQPLLILNFEEFIF